MKLSAWHKKNGDTVEWYEPLFSGHMDRVYMSKVFSFTPDYQYYIDADQVIKGGSGYCIETVNGIEVYRKERDAGLPQEVEHTYPDYGLYPELCKNTAYGFLTRGCPRGCNFLPCGGERGKVFCKKYFSCFSYSWLSSVSLLSVSFFKSSAGEMFSSSPKSGCSRGSALPEMIRASISPRMIP